ncbi:hypothetical protein [Gimesia aquarii]|nr:hypothetical protein [Gimesia aquarii]
MRQLINSFVEFVDYPALGGGPNAKRKVIVTNVGDLATIRVETNYIAPEESAYWIDLTRGHMVVRLELENSRDKK